MSSIRFAKNDGGRVGGRHSVVPEVLLLRWTADSGWIRLCAVAIGLGVEERVLDLQRISWRSEVVKGGWDMDGLHKMNLQQIDSPDSKDSHHPGQYLGYVSADHENLS